MINDKTVVFDVWPSHTRNPVRHADSTIFVFHMLYYQTHDWPITNHDKLQTIKSYLLIVGIHLSNTAIYLTWIATCNKGGP